MDNRAFLLCELLVILLVVSTTAHFGGKPDIDASAQTSQTLGRLKRALDSCLNSDKSHHLRKRAAKRRAQFFELLRSKGHLSREKRDAATVLATSHHSKATNLSIDSNPFSSTTACVLSPEISMGPYWVQGELIRNDLRETQPGIDLYLDVQLIDVNTCQPVSKAHLDIWSCNATGIYSGVTGDETLDETFLRGVVATNHDGVAQFTTKFPGHYSARTSHIHVITRLNGEVLPNGTYSGGSIPHIGEIFFDQDLLTQVRSLSPYSQNAKKFKLNFQDRYFNISSAADADPVMNYVWLGSSLSDGILGWITMGVDRSADHSDVAYAASKWTKDGGLDLQLGDKWMKG